MLELVGSYLHDFIWPQCLLLWLDISLRKKVMNIIIAWVYHHLNRMNYFLAIDNRLKFGGSSTFHIVIIHFNYIIGSNFGGMQFSMFHIVIRMAHFNHELLGYRIHVCGHCFDVG